MPVAEHRDLVLGIVARVEVNVRARLAEHRALLAPERLVLAREPSDLVAVALEVVDHGGLPGIGDESPAHELRARSGRVRRVREHPLGVRALVRELVQERHDLAVAEPRADHVAAHALQEHDQHVGAPAEDRPLVELARRRAEVERMVSREAVLVDAVAGNVERVGVLSAVERRLVDRGREHAVAVEIEVGDVLPEEGQDHARGLGAERA
jgi:hypothetical protein